MVTVPDPVRVRSTSPVSVILPLAAVTVTVPSERIEMVDADSQVPAPSVETYKIDSIVEPPERRYSEPWGSVWLGTPDPPVRVGLVATSFDRGLARSALDQTIRRGDAMAFRRRWIKDMIDTPLGPTPSTAS